MRLPSSINGRLARAALAALVATLPASPALAFGTVAEQAVILGAIDSLPKGLKPFYRDHRIELPTLSPEAEPRERAPPHFGLPLAGLYRVSLPRGSDGIRSPAPPLRPAKRTSPPHGRLWRVNWPRRYSRPFSRSHWLPVFR